MALAKPMSPGAEQDHPIVQAQRLEHALGVGDHLLVFRVAVLGLDDLDQLDLVELVDADHAAGADARRAGLAAKTRRVGAVGNRKLVLREEFLAMDVGDGRFGGRDEIQFAERGGVQPFLDGVILVGELGELADAFEALRPDHERRRDLGVAVLAGVQVEHELNQRPLQLGAPIRVEDEAAAREFGGAREIHQPQALAQLDVRLGFESEHRLLAVDADNGIILRAFADRHGLVGQVRQPQHQLVPGRFRFRGLLVQLRDPVAQIVRISSFF